MRPEALEPWVRGRLHALGPRLGVSLRPPFDALLARLGLGDGASTPYFLHPLALPVLQLPCWAAQGALSGSRLEEILESAALGYLAVRVQDDLIDEGVGDPPEAALLASALLSRHLALLGRGGALPALVEERWLAYHDAMLLERGLSRDAARVYDEALFARVLARTGPLAVPPAVALLEAGRASALPPLLDFCDALASAHQRLLDLLDARKDLANGNLSPTVRRFRGSGEPGAMARALFLEGGFDACIQEAFAELDRAGEAARAWGCPSALDYLKARRRDAMTRQEAAFRTFFDEVLRSGAPRAPSGGSLG